jgi:transposase
MSNTTHRPESTAAALYVALELSTNEWLLTMSTAPDAPRQRSRVRPGDRAALVTAVAAAKARFGLPDAASVRSCHEAGRDGFWPHRLLLTLGVTNLVVDSSSIEVSRRARRAKTDRLDGNSLLRMLLRYWGGERDLWQVVHVPTPAAEDARHASRGLTTLTAERTRYRNRIHSLLALHGVAKQRIDGRWPERLAGLRDWTGAPLPAGVQARVLETWRVLQVIEAERQRARRGERQQARATAAATRSPVQRLVQLRGVAARSATVLVEELFRRDLRNRRQVGALTGLVSAPYASGTTRIDQGLVRSGLPAVRRIAIELAWAWRRYQPTSALTQWYEQRFGRGGAVTRRIGIVALARRVVIALWRYVHHGMVPDGALLKP